VLARRIHCLSAPRIRGPGSNAGVFDLDQARGRSRVHNRLHPMQPVGERQQNYHVFLASGMGKYVAID